MKDIIGNERVGQINKNKFGSNMIVEEYNNSHDIWVRFIETGNMVHAYWYDFCRGSIKNPYDRSIHGVGFIGEGTYKSSINGQNSKQYSVWYDMLYRCYSKKPQLKHSSYAECTVADEWHNFQTFAKWWDENYYLIEGDTLDLDKDILKKGNKLYSPYTGVFVPNSINKLFIKCNVKRGALPIGVYFHKISQKYIAVCSNGNGKQFALGSFNTPEDAFQEYKKYKEKIIKQIAKLYKDKIPTILYEAMLSYKVEIDD